MEEILRDFEQRENALNEKYAPLYAAVDNGDYLTALHIRSRHLNELLDLQFDRFKQLLELRSA